MMEDLQESKTMGNEQQTGNREQHENVQPQDITQSGVGNDRDMSELQTMETIPVESEIQQGKEVEEIGLANEIMLQDSLLTLEANAEPEELHNPIAGEQLDYPSKKEDELVEIVQQETSKEEANVIISVSPSSEAQEDTIEPATEKEDVKKSPKKRAARTKEGTLPVESEIPQVAKQTEETYSVNEITLQDSSLTLEANAELEELHNPIAGEQIAIPSEKEDELFEIVQQETSKEEADSLISASPTTEKQEDTIGEATEKGDIKKSPKRKTVITGEEKDSEKKNVAILDENFGQEELKITDDFFDHLNRKEVVEMLEEIVGEKDILKIKKQVSLLKIRFLKLNKEDKEIRLQLFLANGGNKDDYDYSADELELSFNEAFERYKANKLKYTEDLEQTKIENLAKKQLLLEDLKELIESSTDSLKHIYDRFKEIQVMWKEIGAVPQANVTELWQNYHFYVEKFFDKVKINRELRDLDLKKNLEHKLEICEKTEALLLESSIVKSFKLLQRYHQEWKESGLIEEDKKEELWNRFKTASDKINTNRRDYYEQLYEQQEENYQAKLALCDKMDEFTNVEFASLKQINEYNAQVFDLFRTWKMIGTAPQEVSEEVWNRFRSAMDTFITNKNQYLTHIKEEGVTNYNLRLNLCMQAEAMSLRKDWKKATAEILELQEEWKKIGYISSKQSGVLWKRLRKACDAFFTAKKEYYRNVQQHEAENLQKKEDLIKQVNEYVFVESREANFEALKSFQREWMSVGYTATSEKERLWDAFRKAIDKRFDELKISFQGMDKTKYTERVHTLMEKENKEGGTLEKEQRFLQNKIKQLTDDVNLWENNLGFFAHSKNSDALKEQFGKKIEQSKQEIESLKTKLAIIKTSSTGGAKEDTNKKSTNNKARNRKRNKYD